MTFAWTPHRFSGGALALDLANSIVLRHDPARSIDRMADRAEIGRFAEAAAHLSRDVAGTPLLHPSGADGEAALLDLREAIDRHFRALAQGRAEPLALADLLEQCARAIRLSPVGDMRESLLSATASSALSLLAPDLSRRIRICAHCGWLFVDRSRNASRLWCDMAVCGNRVKAARHYSRTKRSPQP